jgi:hypothetical protein
MTVLSLLPVLVVAAAVVVPLAYEYAGLRREWGIGRLGAMAATSTLFPALGLGLALSLPLDGVPIVRWLAAVTVTIAAYSLALAALRPIAAPERSR